GVEARPRDAGNQNRGGHRCRRRRARTKRRGSDLPRAGWRADADGGHRLGDVARGSSVRHGEPDRFDRARTTGGPDRGRRRSVDGYYSASARGVRDERGEGLPVGWGEAISATAESATGESPTARA